VLSGKRCTRRNQKYIGIAKLLLVLFNTSLLSLPSATFSLQEFGQWFHSPIWLGQKVETKWFHCCLVGGLDITMSPFEPSLMMP
jgi:hypothetical protein